MPNKQTKPKTEKQTKPKTEKEKGVAFVYDGDLDKTSCYGVDFEKGEKTLVTSELGINKLSKHPHFKRA